MLTSEEILSVDRSGLILDYEDWPRHCNNASNVELSVPSLEGIQNVVYVGMGGSGCAGDILSDWSASRSDIPVVIVKDCHLPRFVNERTLVMAVSCSGDTEEALNAASEGVERGARVATVSSGGLLLEFSKKKGIPYTKVPRLRTPRSSFPYLFFPPLRLMIQALAIEGGQSEVDTAVEAVGEMHSLIRMESSVESNPAKQIANQTSSGVPLIYAARSARGVALRFKDSLNENAKVHAIDDYIPELCHNEIEAACTGSETVFKPILIGGVGETTEMEARFEAVRELLRANSPSIYEFSPTTRNGIPGLLSTLYCLDVASIYVAVLRGVDPVPTLYISQFKELLRRKLDFQSKSDHISANT